MWENNYMLKKYKGGPGLKRWTLVLFTTPQKEQVLGVYQFNTMRHLSYVVGVPLNSCQNFYHTCRRRQLKKSRVLILRYAHIIRSGI